LYLLYLFYLTSDTLFQKDEHMSYFIRKVVNVESTDLTQ
jgi:hypothetical protein